MTVKKTLGAGRLLPVRGAGHFTRGGVMFKILIVLGGSFSDKGSAHYLGGHFNSYESDI